MQVECPCCKGVGYLNLYHELRPTDAPWTVLCTHCMGVGVISTDASSPKRDSSVVPPKSD